MYITIDANYASYEGIVGQWVAGSGTSRTWILETVGSGSTSDLEFYYYDTSNNFVGPVQGGTLSKNRWHHVAACRSGNTIRMFVDGVMYGSGTSISVDIKNSTDPLWIGRVVTGYWNGFISNARVVNGTALYTSNFTPPTEPLTNVTNTKLLCCQSNTSAVDTAVVPGTAPNTRNWSARSNWNSGGTLTNASSYPLTAAFDGNLSTTFAMSYAGGMIWTAPATISFSSSIEVYVNSSIGTGGQGFIVTISGVQQSKVDLNAAGSWETVYSGSGTFDKLEMTRNDGGNNNNLWISAIRVDGTVLVDAIAGHGDTAATTFNPFNTDINTVRGQETGYATLNPLKVSNTSSIVLSDGNLRVDITGNYYNAVSTLGMSSGKFYCETSPVRGYSYFGIATWAVVPNTWGGDQTNNSAWVLHGNGSIYHNNATTNGTGFPSTSGTAGGYTLGLLFDADNKTMRYVYNGAISKVYNMANTVDGDSYYFFVGGDAGSYEIDVNFGQKPFKFSPLDGFQPLNAVNVRPETVFARPDQFFDTKLYTGTTQSPRTIDLSMTPDMIWIKNRTDNGTGHYVFDTVRGDNQNLRPDDSYTQAAVNGASHGIISTIGFNSFTVKDGSSSGNNVGSTGTDNYVAWHWKAGGNKGTFNVDDVGYASASDVNMAVGDLNSSFYNTSETWSNGLSALSGSSLTNPPNGFNGVLDSYADSTAGFTLDLSGHTFGTGAHTIEVKSGGATSFSVGGASGSGSLTDPGGGGAKVWTGTYTGEINSITSSASGASVYYVKIDGKILVNSGTDLSGLTQYPSIAPSGCSVGTKQGFSIIKYEGNGSSGATLPHGLTQAPDFAVVKNIEETESWGVYHSSQGGTKYSFLNVNNDFSASSALWNNTDPTSSVLTLGNYNGTNKNNIDFIAYLWHDIPGLQKFGSYTGNSNANGSYVELGFRPALLWLKRTDAAGNWVILDTKRNPSNPVTTSLYIDTTDQDYNPGQDWADILSSGFKLRATYGEVNVGSYIYCAWAEAPAFNLYGGQSNAR